VAKNLNFAKGEKRSMRFVEQNFEFALAKIFWRIISKSALAPSQYNFNSLISAKKKKQKCQRTQKAERKEQEFPSSVFLSHLSSSLLKSKPQRARLRFSWVFTKPFFGCFKERERERERRLSVCLSVFSRKKNSSL